MMRRRRRRRGKRRRILSVVVIEIVFFPSVGILVFFVEILEKHVEVVEFVEIMVAFGVVAD
jgi:hypothetical protein